MAWYFFLCKKARQQRCRAQPESKKWWELIYNQGKRITLLNDDPFSIDAGTPIHHLAAENKVFTIGKKTIADLNHPSMPVSIVISFVDWMASIDQEFIAA